MNSANFEIVIVLIKISKKKSYTCADVSVFSHLFDLWYENMQTSAPATSIRANKVISLPLQYVKANLEGDAPKTAIKQFRASLDEFVSAWTDAIIKSAYKNTFDKHVNDFCTVFADVPPKTIEALDASYSRLLDASIYAQKTLLNIREATQTGIPTGELQRLLDKPRLSATPSANEMSAQIALLETAVEQLETCSPSKPGQSNSLLKLNLRKCVQSLLLNGDPAPLITLLHRQCCDNGSVNSKALQSIVHEHALQHAFTYVQLGLKRLSADEEHSHAFEARLKKHPNDFEMYVHADEQTPTKMLEETLPEFLSAIENNLEQQGRSTLRSKDVPLFLKQKLAWAQILIDQSSTKAFRIKAAKHLANPVPFPEDKSVQLANDNTVAAQTFNDKLRDRHNANFIKLSIEKQNALLDMRRAIKLEIDPNSCHKALSVLGDVDSLTLKSIWDQVGNLQTVINTIETSDEAVHVELDALETRKIMQGLALNSNPARLTGILKSKTAIPSQQNDALRHAFTFIELALDRMSEGTRDTRYHERLEQHTSTSAQLFELARQQYELKPLTKTIKPIFDAIRECLSQREGLDAHDEDLKLLCQQRIEHAMVVRRFTFKARPKHFNYIDASTAIRDTRTVFDAAGVDFFLVSGTLLGAVREKGFIQSDYDIDLGIFDSQADIAKIKQIVDDSDLFVIDEVVEDSIVKIRHITGIVIDLFIFFEMDGLQCHRGGVHEWYNSDFGLTEIDFLGGRYYIPDNHEEWLEENYGNWQKPVLFYDMSYDTPNRDYIATNTKGIYYLWDRFSNAVNNGWNAYLSMAANAMAREFNIDFTRHLPPALRRADKVEPALTKFAPEDVKHVIVGTFDAINTNLVKILGTLPQDSKVIASVYSDNYVSTNAIPSCSNGEAHRLRTASALRQISGVSLLDESNDIDHLQSRFTQAKIQYLA